MTQPQGIPASALAPAAFGEGGKPGWIWEQKDIPEGGEVKLYLTSGFKSGWRYFTANKEIRLSLDEPLEYDDIGYLYGHGPGKVDKEGSPMEERSTPDEIWIARAWVVEEERMACVIIHSYTLMKKINKILQNSDYLMLDSGVTNFYLTLYKEKSKGRIEYDATGSLRVLNNDEAYAQAALPWHAEAYFLGGSPFEEPAQPPRPGSRPTTVRDENGADQMVEVKTQERKPRQRQVNW